MGSTKLNSIASASTRIVKAAAIFVFLTFDAAVVDSAVKIRFNDNRAENPYAEDIYDSLAAENPKDQQEDLDRVLRDADQSGQQFEQDARSFEENNISGSEEQFSKLQINENGISTGDDLDQDGTPSFDKGKGNMASRWETLISLFRWLLRPNNENLQELNSEDITGQRNKRSDDGLLPLVDYKTSLLINTMSSQNKDSAEKNSGLSDQRRRRWRRQNFDDEGRLMNGNPMDRMILEKYLPQRIKKDTVKEMPNKNSADSFKNYYEPLHLHLPIISDLTENNLDSYDGINLGDDPINSNGNSNQVNANLRPVNLLDLIPHRTKRSSPALDELSLAETLRQIHENRMITPPAALSGILQKRSVSYRVPSSEMLDSLIMDQDSFQDLYDRQKRNPDLVDDERQGFKALELRNSGYITPVDNESVGSLSRSKRSIAGPQFKENLPFPGYNLLQQKFSAFKEPFEPIDESEFMNSFETVTVSPKIKPATTTQLQSELTSSGSKQFPLFNVPLTKNMWLFPAGKMSELSFQEQLRCILICNWIKRILTTIKLRQSSRINLLSQWNSLTENMPSPPTAHLVDKSSEKSSFGINTKMSTSSGDSDHYLLRRKRSVSDEPNFSQALSENWILIIKLYFKIINQQCSQLFLHDLFNSFETNILQIIQQQISNIQFPFKLTLQSETKHFNQLLECSNNNRKYPSLSLPLDIYKSYLDYSSSPLTFQQLYPNLINSNEIEEGEPVTRLKRYKRNIIKNRVNFGNIIIDDDDLKRKIILLQKVISEVINHVQNICEDYISENSIPEGIKHLLNKMVAEEFGGRDMELSFTNERESQWLKILTALDTCKVY